jgi:hypothetical protein
MLFSESALAARAITSHREQGVLRQVPTDPCWKTTRLHIRLVRRAGFPPPRDDGEPSGERSLGYRSSDMVPQPDPDSSQYVLLKNHELRQATQTRHPS